MTVFVMGKTSDDTSENPSSKDEDTGAVIELKIDEWNKRMKSKVHKITFAISAVLAMFVCYQSAMRYFLWMSEIVIDRTDVHISEIPFPAITLCPVYKMLSPQFKVSKADRFLIDQFLHDLRASIPEDDDMEDFNAEALQIIQHITEGEILDHFNVTCENFFIECTWRKTKRNCCELFREVLQGRFTCFTFNSMMVKNRDPTWPWSENRSGKKSGLKVVVRLNSTILMSKIMTLIHYPYETTFPQTFYVQGEKHISIDALKFFADPGVRSLAVGNRRCYFSDEIAKYKVSTDNCWSTCRINYIAQMCNCTLRYLASKDTLSRDYCNLTNLPCILRYKAALLTNGNIFDNETIIMECNCYPNCNNVQYRTIPRYDIVTGIDLHNNSHALIDVHFLRETIFSYRLAMVYSFLDLMVGICGIIALFLGISFISVIETIQDYFHRRKKARALAKLVCNK